MALAHSPKIVTNGLVFAYDMSNTQKSWKGAPTTNIIYASPTWAGDGANQGAFVRESVLVTDDSLTYQGLQTFLYSPGTSLNCYLQGSGADFPSTASTQWTFSCYVKREDGAAITSMSVYMYYPSSDGAAAGTVENAGDGWYRIYRTRTGTSSAISLAGFTGMAGSVKYYLSGAMLTATTIPVAGLAGTASRSDTDALIDLTGNNTINANSLTYNSDNTFSFNSSLLSTTIGSGRNVASNPITIQAFVKSNTTSSARMWIDVTGNGTNQRLYSSLNVVGQSSSMGIQSSAWSSSIPINTNWHHQAIVFDGTTATAYDNGVVASSKAYTSYTLPGNIIVGGRSGYYWSGEISAFSVYDRALTADEIQQNFNALRGRYGI